MSAPDNAPALAASDRGRDLRRLLMLDPGLWHHRCRSGGRLLAGDHGQRRDARSDLHGAFSQWRWLPA